MKSSTKGHIAVLAFPFASHPSILLLLTKKLASALPQLRFSFFNTPESNHTLFSKLNPDRYPNITPHSVGDGLPEGYVFRGNPVEPVEYFVKGAEENLRRSMEAAVRETGVAITCLLTDVFLWFSCGFAEGMGIPWVGFWLGGFRSLSAHMYTDVIVNALESAGGEQNADKIIDFIPGMSPLRFSDLPKEILRDRDTALPNMLYKAGVSVPKATAILFNAYDEFDPIVVDDLKSKLKRVLTIGPLTSYSQESTQEDDNECLSWLDKQEEASVAYICFGSTFLTPTEPELLALAEALETKGMKYLWTFRDSSKRHLLEGFFQRSCTKGKVVQWSPQLQVLAHSAVGVYVTHGGWSSTLESIEGGVPMICRPFFADQMLNTKLIQDVWKIGVGIEGVAFTKSGMLRALDLVFFSEAGKKMKENIFVLKERGKKAVAPDGRSTENFESLLEILNGSDA